MAIDDQVAIMGNANMDTQSWFHSQVRNNIFFNVYLYAFYYDEQEINTMIDSPLIVKEWIDALYKNQSTNEYGRLDNEGQWRDADGNLNPHNGK